MGKLRLESKTKSMDRQRYDMLHDILKEARAGSQNAHVFWDLDKDEDANVARKEFMTVAGKEKISLRIRRPRGAASLELHFSEQREAAPKRISAKESRQRILDVLAEADAPLKKAEIVSRAGINPSTWNIRINDLLNDKKVTRHGKQRTGMYALK